MPGEQGNGVEIHIVEDGKDGKEGEGGGSEDEKKKALKKTLIDLEDRLDIKDTELKSTLENLQANL